MSWLDDASANKIVQSYVNNFMDVSGNFKIRDGETITNTPVSWSQLGSDIDAVSPTQSLGQSIAISNDGTIVALGAYGSDHDGNERGSVEVYEWTGSSWSQLGSDILGEAAGDRSGYSVSLSSDGTILAIGATLNGDGGYRAGHVRVYQYANSTWSQLGSDIDGEAENDHSGDSVSLSSDGTILAIGAR